jgi:DNA (cytosine-5)-methyltransferase 1
MPPDNALVTSGLRVYTFVIANGSGWKGDGWMLTHGELFAGIGGFSTGLARAGIRTLWAVEIDPQARSVLAARHPGIELFEDVREVGAHNLAAVDVITFGSPCQDLSVAGRREGLTGERSGLYFEAIRIIAECRPTIAVWENVPGALSSNGGRDFGAAIDALADIGALDIAWRILDAQWFGVAQRRRRLFVIADFGSQRSGQILFEPEGGGGDSPPRRTAGQDVAGTLSTGASSSGGFRQDLDGTTYIPLLEVNARQGKSPVGSIGVGDPGDPMYTLQSSNQHGVAALDVHGVIQNATRGKSQNGIGIAGDDAPMYTLDGASQHAVAVTANGGTDDLSSTLTAPADGGRYDRRPIALTGPSGSFWDGGQVADTLDCASLVKGQMMPEKRRFPVVMTDPEPLAFGVKDATPAVGTVAPTLRAMTHDTTHANGGGQIGVVTSAVRRLTPRECERLQGFPDDHTLVPDLTKRDQRLMADAPRYRMLGNAVAVPVAAWLGGRIAEAIGDE